MRRKRPLGQHAQGSFIAQAEVGGQATVNVDHAYQGPVTQVLPPRVLPLSRSEARNRQQMLARVRSDWITGILERSLHGVALIDLGLQEVPDAVANPWRFLVQESKRSTRTLPQGTPIEKVYAEAGEELLILGEPGSGKTTLLLQLARDLLDQAERDENHRMPAVFNLSRWAAKRRPLAEWLVDELNAGYGVPREHAEEWVTENEILPLLDGLDEVAPDGRAAAVEAINVYREKHMLPLVVCCRSKVYAAMSAHVNVRRAVTVLPLTDKQVAAYFEEMPSSLKALRRAVLRDKELSALARTPLMLTIFTLVYQGGTAPNLPVGLTTEAKLTPVFAAYVKQMLNRRGELKEGTSAQYCRWLSYLARQMRIHNLTVFSMEDLQPDWLPDPQTSEYNRITGMLRKLLEGREIEPVEVRAWAKNEQGKRELVQQRLSDRSYLDPNEGIWRSLKNGLTGGTPTRILGRLAAAGLVVMRVAAANRRFGQAPGPAGSAAISNTAARSAATMIRYLYADFRNSGIDAFIGHFGVRFLLSRTSSLPWDLRAFLDETSERQILHRVGGSYIFVHPLLRDYFAESGG